MARPSEKQDGDPITPRDANGEIVQSRPAGAIKLNVSGLGSGNKLTFWTANPASDDGAKQIPVTLRPGASGTIRLRTWGPCGADGVSTIDEPVVASVEYVPPVREVHKDGTNVTDLTAEHDRPAQIYVQTESAS